MEEVVIERRWVRTVGVKDSSSSTVFRNGPLCGLLLSNRVWVCGDNIGAEFHMKGR